MLIHPILWGFVNNGTDDLLFKGSGRDSGDWRDQLAQLKNQLSNTPQSAEHSHSNNHTTSPQTHGGAPGTHPEIRFTHGQHPHAQVYNVSNDQSQPSTHQHNHDQAPHHDANGSTRSTASGTQRSQTSNQSQNSNVSRNSSASSGNNTRPTAQQVNVNDNVAASEPQNISGIPGHEDISDDRMWHKEIADHRFNNALPPIPAEYCEFIPGVPGFRWFQVIGMYDNDEFTKEPYMPTHLNLEDYLPHPYIPVPGTPHRVPPDEYGDVDEFDQDLLDSSIDYCKSKLFKKAFMKAFPSLSEDECWALGRQFGGTPGSGWPKKGSKHSKSFVETVLSKAKTIVDRLWPRKNLRYLPEFHECYTKNLLGLVCQPGQKNYNTGRVYERTITHIDYAHLNQRIFDRGFLLMKDPETYAHLGNDPEHAAQALPEAEREELQHLTESQHQTLAYFLIKEALEHPKATMYRPPQKNSPLGATRYITDKITVIVVHLPDDENGNHRGCLKTFYPTCEDHKEAFRLGYRRGRFDIFLKDHDLWHPYQHPED